jgi:DNA replication ATP-dependent helicase Dna2
MSLIERLNKAIDVEYDSKNAEVDELMLLPPEERVQKGDTISNITATFIPMMESNGRILFTQVKITCNVNISKFREGSPVVLSGHGNSFSLNVVEDEGETMLLEIRWNIGSVLSSLNNKSGWYLDPDKVDIRHIVKKSTEFLSYDSAKYKLLNGIFEGTILPKVSSEQLKKGKQLAEKTKLNPTQQEAFANAYATENYYLIQGPPGTGKTWLLAHLALQFAKEGMKILVTASTHTAINNALQKASTISNSANIIKVGKKADAKNLNYDGSTAKNITDFRNSGYNNDSRGIIVGATCYSPFTNKLEFMNWDIVIIDEAGQLSIPLAIAAMVKGKKFILIGDHKQLPPIISDKHDDVTFTKSIFEHLFQFSSGIMLDTTYRMNSAINSFPSKQFYNGKLLPHNDNANWLLNIDNKFALHQEILDINKPEILFCHKHASNDTRSEFEATMIAQFVSEYLKKGVLPKDIAILTPFRAQVRQINKALSKLNNYKTIKEILFVDTIEHIQGQERDIIMFSLAISDPIRAKQRADFFFNPNRLNVALTRPKKKRIVIANKALFELKTYDSGLLLLIKNFKDFYEASTKFIA